MKTIYICVVRLALEVGDEFIASDAVSAILTEQTQQAIPDSCLLDWEYDEHGCPEARVVDDDFGFDSGVPQLFGRVVSV